MYRGVQTMNLETLKDAKKVIGLKQVTKAVKRHSAGQVLLAGDAVGGYWTESEYLSGRPEYNDGEDDDEKDLMDVALEEVSAGL